MKKNIFISALCATVLTLSPIAQPMENPGNNLPKDCFTVIASFIKDPKDMLSLMQASKETYAGVKQFAISPVYSSNPKLLGMQLFL